MVHGKRIRTVDVGSENILQQVNNCGLQDVHFLKKIVNGFGCPDECIDFVGIKSSFLYSFDMAFCSCRVFLNSNVPP